MILANFQTGNTTHLVTLAVIAVAAALLALAIRRESPESHQRLLRLFVGWGCVVAWILNTGYWMLPERFDLAKSLP
ncbi:MAG: hypothetical protein VX317_04460, partial [Verrucomicrobiota bacterium]|nr:hypothetical protein [Verrucomicrobiota bacterium]